MTPAGDMGARQKHVVSRLYCRWRRQTFWPWSPALRRLDTAKLAARHTVVEPNPRESSRWYGLLAAWVVLTALAWPLPNLVLRYYSPFYMPSKAMMPALRPDDRIWADMHISDDLQRGDVVTVREGAVTYIRRIAALPGDRIAMHEGAPIINGQPVLQVFESRERVNEPGYGDVEARILREQLPGETGSHDLLDIGPSAGDEFSEIVLGKDQYFLLGDNRDRSADSRFPRGICRAWRGRSGADHRARAFHLLAAGGRAPARSRLRAARVKSAPFVLIGPPASSAQRRIERAYRRTGSTR